MKQALRVIQNRYNYHLVGGHVYPVYSALSDMPSKQLIQKWKAHVLKYNPTIRPALAHRIAFEIVTRPAYISYMTAYRTAVMDLGVK